MKNDASVTEAAQEVSLEQFFAGDAPVPLHIPGLQKGLFCKLLSLDEMSSVLEDVQNQLKMGARLLALSLVDANGMPLTTVEQWLKLSFKKSPTVQAAVREVSVLNGLVQAEEAEEMGNVSAPTGDCASSSSSA